MNYFSEVGADGDSCLSVLWEEGERVFCRAWREAKNGDRTALLAVIPASEQPTPNCLDRLVHECALKDELDSPWAVRPLEIVRDRRRTMLVLEDSGGEPLNRQLGAPMEVGSFLSLAISIAIALGKLHRRGLVHKHLKPAAHIVANCADGQVRLTGFGIATRLPRERQAWASRSAARSLMRAADGCGQMRMNLEVLCFSSPCRQETRIHEFSAGGLRAGQDSQCLRLGVKDYVPSTSADPSGKHSCRCRGRFARAPHCGCLRP
jgi:serine/threonine protein kinase